MEDALKRTGGLASARLAWGMCAALSPLFGCDSTDTRAVPPGPDVSASVSAAATSASMPRETNVDQDVLRLRRAEVHRKRKSVRDEDISSRSVLVRRAAARALARIGTPATRPLLFRLLNDEDQQVLTWAAYGVGDQCAGYRDASVRALLAALPMVPNKPTPSSEGMDAGRAIIRAVGRCASNASESALSKLLLSGKSKRDPAIEGLGDIATQKNKLREETFAALLSLASGSASKPAVVTALYPFGRVAHLPPHLVERTRQVAVNRLAEASPGRIFAIRALGRCDSLAVAPLREVIEDVSDFSASERSEAVRALVRFGQVGQRALQKALKRLVMDPSLLSAERIVTADFVTLLTILDALDDVGDARDVLRGLTKQAPKPDASEAVKRRFSWVRCTASRLLAERDFDAKMLKNCDLTKRGQIGRRAMVDTLAVDGVKWRGRRLSLWRSFAEGEDVRARQRAIEHLAAHPEVRDTPAIVASALEAKSPGVVTAAAQLIAKHPQRVRKKKRRARRRKKGAATGKVDPGVKKALLAYMTEPPVAVDLEALSAVFGAIGALGLDEAKKPLERWCASPYVTARKHAKKALTSLLGGRQKVSCPAPEQGLKVLERWDEPVKGPVVVVLKTEIGSLSMDLNPNLAPVAVRRVTDLVSKGFYDGIRIHRAISGFVTQFGSPFSDGFGGPPELPPLPCETSPFAFDAMRVGVALAGRDTGSSQLFVTHAAYPHLDGRYAWIGRATGSWDAAVDGDRIVEARIERR